MTVPAGRPAWELAIDSQDAPAATSAHAVDFDIEPHRDGIFFILKVRGSLEANGEFLSYRVGNNG